jgi:O-antigen ligase
LKGLSDILNALLQNHPNPRWQRHWQVVQVGLILLPFAPLLATACVLLPALAIWRQEGRKLLRQPVTQGFALLSGWLIITCFFAVKPDHAWLGLANFLPFFLVFPALSHLIQTAAQLRQIAAILVLTAVPIAVLGLGQLYGGWAGQIELPWVLVKWTIDPMGNPPGRMASLFFYANVLASYLVTTFILSLGLWIESLGGRVGAVLRNQSPRLAQICLGGITALMAIALILTNSRNAWAVALIACLVLALYYGWRWIVGAVLAIAAVLGGAAFAPLAIAQPLRLIVPAFFWARLNDQMYSDRPVNQLRSTQWQFAGSLAQQRPLTGWGLRSFTALYEAQMHLWLGHPHSLLLMMLAETGMPGAVMLFGLVGWVLGRAVNAMPHLSAGAAMAGMGNGTHPISAGDAMNRVSTAAGGAGRDRLMLFLTVFLANTLFSFLDITFFDVRINLMNWIILSAIWGMAQRDRLTLPD